MNNKIAWKILGFLLNIFGIILLLNGLSGITGFIVLEGVGKVTSSILGLIFIIVGLLIVNSRTKKESELVRRAKNYNPKINYFKERAKEIFNPKFNNQSVWVSRWELNGILNYIQTARDPKGKLVYTDVDIEHNKKRIGQHWLGKEQISHMHIYLKLKHEDVDRHLYITNDPLDERLIIVGYEGTHIDPERSQILKVGRPVKSMYNPAHPVSGAKSYKTGIDITFELGLPELVQLDMEIDETRKRYFKSKASDPVSKRTKTYEEVFNEKLRRREDLIKNLKSNEERRVAKEVKKYPRKKHDRD